MYIGNQKIKSTLKDGDDIIVTFSNKSTLRLYKDVFEMSKTKEESKGQPLDIVYNRLAHRIFAELSIYGVKIGEVSQIISHLGNLTHNLEQEKIGEKFGVSNRLEIKLSQLID